MALPKFDFSKSSIKTSDQLKEAGGNNGGGSKYFQPGSYEVVIKSVVHQGPMKDPSWHKFLLTYEGIDDKTITAQVFVPTAELQYKSASGKPTLALYNKLTRFLKALGETVTPENVADILGKYFTNADKALRDKQLNITVGYEGDHVRYDGKDQAGNKRYMISVNSQPMLGEDAQPLVFGDFKAAEAFAEEREIELSKFVNVLNYAKSSVAAAKKASNW